MYDGPVLQMRHITKTFPGTKAIDAIDLEVERGNVHALVGENGAGKSTLMKILAGLYQPDSGQILLNGRRVEIRRPMDALNLGISMIHQELNPIPEMTVAENIFIGREPCYRHTPVVNVRKQRILAKQLLDEMEIDISPDVKLKRLSVAETQVIEIIKAISFNSQIIIMDEPSSAISDSEIEHLFGLIRKAVQRNVAIIFISHKMDEIFEISDVVSVLRDGRLIGTSPIREMNHEKIISMMVGRELESFFPKGNAEVREITLAVRNLCKEGKFRNVSFFAKRGEILGIAGLMGAGRTALAEAILGIDPADAGHVTLCGREQHIRKPIDAISRNLAYVPEDRKLKALNPKGSVRENISIMNLQAFCRLPQLIDRRAERRQVDRQIRSLGIKTPSREQIVNSLSGGNQQKVVLARCLIGDPEILILDEPTRGIDVGAKAEIYKIMNMLAENGKTILMISSEMPEILAMSDRIIVLHEGEITGEFQRADFNQAKIMRCAMGYTSEAK